MSLSSACVSCVHQLCVCVCVLPNFLCSQCVCVCGESGCKCLWSKFVLPIDVYVFALSMYVCVCALSVCALSLCVNGVFVNIYSCVK